MLALGVIGIFLFVGGLIYSLTHKQLTPIPPKTLALIAKAEQGDVAAQYSIAMCYDAGLEGLAKDNNEALKWFHRAAGQNHILAQSHLAWCYTYGRDVVKDEVEAAKWWRKAAGQNDRGSQWQLGVCYQQGRGLAKDDAEAVKWFRKAAEQDFGPCQIALAECYTQGRGVAQDYVEAYAWHNLNSNRWGNARSFMAPLAAKMSPQQLADAEKRTKELRSEIEAKTKASGP